MNEQTKTYIRYFCYVIAVIFICATIWFLFRDIHDNGTTANDVREQLDSVAEQQRNAEKSLESVQSGIDDSLGTVGELEQSNNNAKSATTGITESNNNIETAVNNAQRSNDNSAAIIADSERRISESKSILQEIRTGTGTNTK